MSNNAWCTNHIFRLNYLLFWIFNVSTFSRSIYEIFYSKIIFEIVFIRAKSRFEIFRFSFSVKVRFYHTKKIFSLKIFNHFMNSCYVRNNCKNKIMINCETCIFDEIIFINFYQFRFLFIYLFIYSLISHLICKSIDQNRKFRNMTWLRYWFICFSFLFLFVVLL